jgi:hypothetical protein
VSGFYSVAEREPMPEWAYMLVFVLPTLVSVAYHLRLAILQKKKEAVQAAETAVPPNEQSLLIKQ